MFKVQQLETNHLAYHLADALVVDPFYASISIAFQESPLERREVLAQYFAYSLREGVQLGRIQMNPYGAAIWTLPQSAEKLTQASIQKKTFLSQLLGRQGISNYQAIVQFMEPHATNVVPSDAWYLSIIGVSPAVQGKGIGVELLRPTLDSADQSQKACYLETFTPRNISFYNRLGFMQATSYFEPITQAICAVMIRQPT